jgi:hypothetical protein
VFIDPLPSIGCPSIVESLNSGMFLPSRCLTMVICVTVYFKKAYDPVRREIISNILIDFGVGLKIVRLIKMCLNVTCSNAHICKHLSCTFSIKKTKRRFFAIALKLCSIICH